MHVIYSHEDRRFPLFYHRRGSLTRADSLPYFFHRMRIHRNLTRKALAQRCGVSEEYVSAIENGSKFPSVRYCLKCSDLFGANPSWIKSKWLKEAIERFSNRLMKRLGLDD